MEINETLEQMSEIVKSVKAQCDATSAELHEVKQMSVQKSVEENAALSVGEQFVKSAEFGRISDADPRCVFKAATTSGAVAAMSTAPGQLVKPVEAPLGLAAVIPHIRTSASVIPLVKRTAFTNNAAAAAEGSEKAESTFEFTTVNLSVVTMAHVTLMSKQLIEDAPAVADLINAEMQYGLASKIDGYVGSTLLTSGNYTDKAAVISAASCADKFDLISVVKTDLESKGYQPNVIMLNPADWGALKVTKDKQGRYVVGGPVMPDTETVWGLKVVTSAFITAGKYVLGDFNRCTRFYDRTGVEVALSDSDRDNFVKNLLTLRVESRGVLGVTDAAGIAGGNFAISGS